MTKLSTFIQENTDEILADWATFARSLATGGHPDIETLQNDAREMLDAIVLDLNSAQTPAAQAEKSKGLTDAGETSTTAAQAHGADRAKRGFTVAQTVAEFRALRASVLRLWAERARTIAGADLDDMTRFNEAIDQAIAESIVRFARDIKRNKDLLVAVIGHDLRTPVSSLLLSASFLLESAELGESLRTPVAIIARSAKRISLMVDDVLDLARAGFGGPIPLAREDMDLRPMIDEMISEIAATYPRRALRVKSKGDLRGQWDRNRVARALSNLVGNALQHGSPDAPVRVAANGTEDDVMISVQNRGPVIPPDILRRLVDGSVVDRPEFKDGKGHLGLGLYIVNVIVRAHGGRVEARSSRDAGTRITLYLPRFGTPVPALGSHADRPRRGVQTGS